MTAACVGGPGDGLRGAAHVTVRAGQRPCEGRIRSSTTSPTARSGARLEPGTLDVDRPIVVGAPECNGFHATLLTRTDDGGLVCTGRRGVPFSGRGISCLSGQRARRSVAVDADAARRQAAPSARHPGGICGVARRGGRVVVRSTTAPMDVTGAPGGRRLGAVARRVLRPAGGLMRLVAVGSCEPASRSTIDPKPRGRRRTGLAWRRHRRKRSPHPRGGDGDIGAFAPEEKPRELVAERYRTTRQRGSGFARGESGVFIWRHVRGAWHLGASVRRDAGRAASGCASRRRDSSTATETCSIDRVTDGTGGCGHELSLPRWRAGSDGCTATTSARERSRPEAKVSREAAVGPCPHHPGSANCSAVAQRPCGSQASGSPGHARTIECALLAPRSDRGTAPDVR